MNQNLYVAGLILVVIFIFMGLDDFVWDVIILLRTLMGKKGNKELDLKEVDEAPERLLAVLIAAWHEENVIEEVLDHFIKTTLYPKSQYHVFVGVYPNDQATIDAVNRAAAVHANIHLVINELAGPTTKAQNLNYVAKQIVKFEKERNWHFKSFTVHDSEDVVHSFELRYTNYIMSKYAAVQFPVFPLIEYPTFKNFFKNITTNTYADEFSEHHYLTMVYRNSVNAFVPSAGTGFALSRRVLDMFDNYDFLPEDSLTEDYKLAYNLYKKNEQLHYILDEVPYIDHNLKIKKNFVATRAMFPNTFKTAVRQKTRWITGITMQSVEFKDIFRKNGLSFTGRYSLYRDQKAKVGNLIAFIGYPFFIYFLLSLFINLPVIYPKYSISWYLSLVVTIMMLERLVFRTVSIYKVYGLKSVFFSTMFPPIIPIRYVWGNMINFVATIKAYQQILKKRSTDKETRKEKKEVKVKVEKKLKWDKTEHYFLNPDVLKRYYHRLGDLLLKRGYISIKDLKRGLNNIGNGKYEGLLGTYLLDTGVIEERHLLKVLGDLKQRVFIEVEALSKILDTTIFELFQLDDLKKYNVTPIFSFKGSILMVTPFYLNDKFIKEFEEKHPEYTLHWHYSYQKSIRKVIEQIEFKDPDFYNERFDFSKVGNHHIDETQLLLTMNWACRNKTEFEEALSILGLKSV